MIEHGILFNGAMVQATLDGRKTQTRRVVKPQPDRAISDWDMSVEPGDTVLRLGWPYRIVESRGRNKRDAGELSARKINCSYGQPGDRLWVRETHYMFGRWILGIDHKWHFNHCRGNAKYFDNPPDLVRKKNYHNPGWYKRASIHMPRWASRITLEIVAVRVERVWDITRSGIIAEGVELGDLGGADVRNKWQSLWDSINAKRGYGWEKNPWVWVIEFKKIKP